LTCPCVASAVARAPLLRLYVLLRCGGARLSAPRQSSRPFHQLRFPVVNRPLITGSRDRFCRERYLFPVPRGLQNDRSWKRSSEGQIKSFDHPFQAMLRGAASCGGGLIRRHVPRPTMASVRLRIGFAITRLLASRRFPLHSRDGRTGLFQSCGNGLFDSRGFQTICGSLTQTSEDRSYLLFRSQVWKRFFRGRHRRGRLLRAMLLIKRCVRSAITRLSWLGPGSRHR
jgi:hypothetical protein